MVFFGEKNTSNKKEMLWTTIEIDFPRLKAIDLPSLPPKKNRIIVDQDHQPSLGGLKPLAMLVRLKYLIDSSTH